MYGQHPFYLKVYPLWAKMSSSPPHSLSTVRWAFAFGQQPRPLSQNLTVLPAPPKGEPTHLLDSAAAGREPQLALPLGELSPQVTERVSPLPMSRHPVIGTSLGQSDTIAVSVALTLPSSPSQSKPDGFASVGLRHPASASCLGRHSRLAGRCPNSSSLFPPQAAVVAVAPKGGANAYPRFSTC